MSDGTRSQVTVDSRPQTLTRTIALHVVELLARLYPFPVDPSQETADSLRFLEWPVSADRLVRAGYGGGLIACSVTMFAVFFVSAGFRSLWGLIALASGLCVVHVIHTLPGVCATARKTRALGMAPDLVSRAVLRMRLSPTPERAAAFAADSGSGILARSLSKHVRQARQSSSSGLSTFGEAWADRFPALGRAFALVTVAGRTRAEDRERLLDRALTVVLDGTSEQMASFAVRIRAPTTALYAFGVLLPTALVALLPAAGVAGIGITPPVVVVVYNLLLPGLLVSTSIWLLAHRPVAFPPPTVTGEHPDVPATTRIAVLAGVGTGVCCWVLTAHLFPWWGPPIGGLGVGAGVTLVVANRPVIAIYDRIREVEEQLPDALELIGRRVATGHAVESALESVADDLDGPMGELLGAGAKQQRQLQIGIEEAFLGHHGVLETVPSQRLRGSFSLLSLAAEEGRPAGTALLALAAHVEKLREIEREARQNLAQVCGTLRSTGMVFAPLVAGTTVGLAGGIGGEAALPGGEQSLTWLGGPVGAYVLLLAVLLSGLSTGLTRGFDRALVGYRVGHTLLSATLVYLCSYLLVGVVV